MPKATQVSQVKVFTDSPHIGKVIAQNVRGLGVEWQFMTERKAVPRGPFWTVRCTDLAQSQYLGYAARNRVQVVFTDATRQRLKPNFVHVADMLGSHFGANACRWHADKQGKTDRLR